jgi:hypothetical protein
MLGKIFGNMTIAIYWSIDLSVSGKDGSKFADFQLSAVRTVGAPNQGLITNPKWQSNAIECCLIVKRAAHEIGLFSGDRSI